MPRDSAEQKKRPLSYSCVQHCSSVQTVNRHLSRKYGRNLGTPARLLFLA